MEEAFLLGGDARGSRPFFQLCSHHKWLRGIGFPLQATFTAAAIKHLHCGCLCFHGYVCN